MFPITLDLTGRTVLVVGGGPVGRRKAVAALEAGGAVTVVDPAPPPHGWAGGWLVDEYRADHLDDVWLVFACGPPEVNARVVADATVRRVWACDAGTPWRGGFTVPAAGRVGRLSVAVSTGGASPGLARTLCDELAARLTPADVMWADLLAELRPRSTAEQRRVLADPAWRARVAVEGIDAVRVAVEHFLVGTT